MNLSLISNHVRLNELCEQIFDYFNLTIYDLETQLDNQLLVENFKNKLDTFSDKHFKAALFEFNNEIQNLKNHFPNELNKLEKLSDEIKNLFNELVDKKIFDIKIIYNLKVRLQDSLNGNKMIGTKGIAVYTVAETIKGIHFLPNSGTFDEGMKFTVYGVK